MVRVPARRPRRVAVENSADVVSRWERSSTGGAHHRSDRKLVATLATARGEDAAAGAGAHPQAEAMRLVTAAVVRLERALAHGRVSECVRWCKVSGRTVCRLAPLRRGMHAGRLGGRCERHRGGWLAAAGRRHAAPVDTCSTAPRYAVPLKAVKPTSALRACRAPRSPVGSGRLGRLWIEPLRTPPPHRGTLWTTA